MGRFKLGEPRQAGAKELNLKKRIGIAVFVSLLFHGLLFFFAPALFKSKDQATRAKEVSIVFRDKPHDMVKALDEALPVVSLAPLPSPKPKEAKLLSEHNHEANKEMLAKERAKSQALSDKPEKRGALALKDENTPQEISKKKSVHFKRVHENDLRSGDDYLKEPRQKTARDPLGLRVPPGTGLKDAMPFNDYVSGVEEGEKTALNAWQWRHASFFNRIKESIAGIWAPNIQIQRFDPSGSMLGHKDRTTVMQVTIDKEGKLSALNVATSSGVSYLDDEAIRTFKEAAPFPFPPAALFKNDALFTFSFAFHVQINRGLKLGFDWNSEH